MVLSFTEALHQELVRSGVAVTVLCPGPVRTEFAAVARSPVQWVPGGHSWMLARPQGQADILTHLVQGVAFKAQVDDRWRQLTPREYTLRAVN